MPRRDETRMSEAEVGAFLAQECKARSVRDGETQLVDRQVAKIVGPRSRRTRIISWDHRKLSGVY
ncbi:hypothetical protein ABIA30_004004 [Mycobacterium sp. MAA66]